MLSRRGFLRGAMAGALSLGLGPLGRAQVPGARKLVIVLAYGGWDTLWALDPKPDNPEVDRVPGDVQWFGDLPIWVHPSRPSVTQFFEQWASSSVVVNGLQMESLAHETCANVMMTADTLGRRDGIGTVVANQLGLQAPLPYLALSPHAKLGTNAAVAGELGVTNQLQALTTPDFGWPAPGQQLPDKGLDMSEAEYGAVSSYLAASTSRLSSANAGSLRNAKMLADFASSRQRMEALQWSAIQGSFLSDYTLFEATEAPWDHVAAALAEGVSQVALIQPDLYWDTHAYNDAQADNYEALFAGLNALMAGLSTGGVLDDTMVLVMSEMGRTPRENPAGGKDHWPWTSALAVGASLNGGRVIGTTDEWLRPSPVNLVTGADDPSGVLLHPGHLHHAVAKALGVPGVASLFPKEALDALLG